MMAISSKMYSKVTVPPAPKKYIQSETQLYRGFSTVSSSTENFKLYDIELIKQDLINHFYIRQGERLMQPDFGTIIWDLLFEPLTDHLKYLIVQNVTAIINYDPRISAETVYVTAYETGIQIECVVTYVKYNMSQPLQLRFDQANGLLAR